ncbi:peptide chain release factor N(5)-glutamine methyltransferase [Paucihalobacter sp.]|uniref:peptide chain release factor N(5)-glutamine methyltransferase n=1 Tax=Paucihalobacter sp. TaxID=2850405 RepID=UPI002FE38328
MTFKEIHTQFHLKLDAEYGKNEVDAMFFLLSEQFLNKKRIDLSLTPYNMLVDIELSQLTEALNRLQNNEPVQYIIGTTYFYGLEFKVNQHTLIPRPETEELVSLAIESLKPHHVDSDKINILDIGTGTGCIAISLAKLIGNAHVFALDISSQALKIAQENAALNAVEVSFIETDILKETNWTENFKNIQFDVIISNPPYVRELEKAQMKDNVLNFEPTSALFVSDEDPLIFYRAIAKFASEYMKPNGLLFFEINQYLAQETKKMLEMHNFETIEIYQDLSGNDRMIKATK